MFHILSNTTPVALPISAMMPCSDTSGWVTPLTSDGLVLGCCSASGAAFLQERRAHELSWNTKRNETTWSRWQWLQGCPELIHSLPISGGKKVTGQGNRHSNKVNIWLQILRSQLLSKFFDPNISRRLVSSPGDALTGLYCSHTQLLLVSMLQSHFQ